MTSGFSPGIVFGVRLALGAVAVFSVAACACGAPGVIGAAGASGATGAAGGSYPVLDEQTARLLAMTADELRGQALGGGGVDGLEAAFAGPALLQLRTRVVSMAGRGFRLEERSATRSLVSLHASWNPLALVVILQVEGEDRLITPDAPDPAWFAIVRQVWSKLLHITGGWRVVETRDLSPESWLAA